MEASVLAPVLESASCAQTSLPHSGGLRDWESEGDGAGCSLSLHFLGAGSAQGSPSDGRELGEREDDRRGSGKNHLDDPYAG
jgi:hypothetical protein